MKKAQKDNLFGWIALKEDYRYIMYSYTKKSGMQKHSVQDIDISSCLDYFLWGI